MPLPKREYNAVSAIADEIWQYRTGDIDEDHDNEEARFLQPSIRLRYNVQLVETRRDWMRVPNLKF